MDNKRVIKEADRNKFLAGILNESLFAAAGDEKKPERIYINRQISDYFDIPYSKNDGVETFINANKLRSKANWDSEHLSIFNKYAGKDLTLKGDGLGWWIIVHGLREGVEVTEFKFKVKHDNGVKKLKTKASSLEAAKQIIMNAEGCPEGALELISEMKKTYGQDGKASKSKYNKHLRPFAKKLANGSTRKTGKEISKNAEKEIDESFVRKMIKKAINETMLKEGIGVDNTAEQVNSANQYTMEFLINMVKKYPDTIKYYGINDNSYVSQGIINYTNEKLLQEYGPHQKFVLYFNSDRSGTMSKYEVMAILPETPKNKYTIKTPWKLYVMRKAPVGGGSPGTSDWLSGYSIKSEMRKYISLALYDVNDDNIVKAVLENLQNISNMEVDKSVDIYDDEATAFIVCEINETEYEVELFMNIDIKKRGWARGPKMTGHPDSWDDGDGEDTEFVTTLDYVKIIHGDKLVYRGTAEFQEFFNNNEQYLVDYDMVEQKISEMEPDGPDGDPY
ncbi:MAG: hypothetical protein KA007_00010 [Candidatus Pacebacteria bacterium]|nr:hypothetical protein [Candidatus Paceibacterota bacterium]